MRDKVKAGTPEGESELLDIIRCGLADVMVNARNAIHAYVEEVKREAREDERRTVAAEAMRIVRRMEAQRGVASEFPAPAPKEGL